MQLENKVALVTGSTSGIGKGIAINFAKEGAKLILDHYRSDKEAQELIKTIEEIGSSAIAVDADVAVMEEVKNLVNRGWEKFGRIDILVNNAGIARSLPFLEIEEELWDRTIATNLKGPFLLSQLVIRKMVENKIKGKVINIVSVNGFQSEKELVAYDASKGGLIALTRTVAAEMGDYGINVNAIAPGCVEGTHIQDDWYGNEEVVNKVLRKTPLHRFGTVQECADLAVFLASDKSNFIQGEVIVLDGGLSILQFD
jgi:NAD(P)-dependent dehydrogenase (short-subunit alcohol dehydrogenase family)